MILKYFNPSPATAKGHKKGTLSRHLKHNKNADNTGASINYAGPYYTQCYPAG